MKVIFSIPLSLALIWAAAASASECSSLLARLPFLRFSLDAYEERLASPHDLEILSQSPEPYNILRGKHLPAGRISLRNGLDKSLLNPALAVYWPEVRRALATALRAGTANSALTAQTREQTRSVFSPRKLFAYPMARDAHARFATLKTREGEVFFAFQNPKTREYELHDPFQEAAVWSTEGLKLKKEEREGFEISLSEDDYGGLFLHLTGRSGSEVEFLTIEAFTEHVERATLRSKRPLRSEERLTYALSLTPSLHLFRYDGDEKTFVHDGQEIMRSSGLALDTMTAATDRRAYALGDTGRLKFDDQVIEVTPGEGVRSVGGPFEIPKPDSSDLLKAPLLFVTRDETLWLAFGSVSHSGETHPVSLVRPLQPELPEHAVFAAQSTLADLKFFETTDGRLLLATLSGKKGAACTVEVFEPLISPAPFFSYAVDPDTDINRLTFFEQPSSRRIFLTAHQHTQSHILDLDLQERVDLLRSGQALNDHWLSTGEQTYVFSREQDSLVLRSLFINPEKAE